MTTDTLPKAFEKEFEHMIFFPIFGALVISTAAYLQYSEAAWKGIACSAALIALASMSVLLLPPGSPAEGGVGALWLGGIGVGVGVIASLVLRNRLSPGRVAMFSFVGGWALLQVLGLVV